MSKKPIIVPCPSGLRHAWVTVWGVHAGPGHLYKERRCVRCKMYESEAR